MYVWVAAPIHKYHTRINSVNTSTTVNRNTEKSRSRQSPRKHAHPLSGHLCTVSEKSAEREKMGAPWPCVFLSGRHLFIIIMRDLTLITHHRALIKKCKCTRTSYQPLLCPENPLHDNRQSECLLRFRRRFVFFFFVCLHVCLLRELHLTVRSTLCLSSPLSTLESTRRAGSDRSFSFKASTMNGLRIVSRRASKVRA